jgi:hypothetical protein
MTDRPPALVKREVQLPDGRRLIFYSFPERAEARDDAPTPAAPRPGRQEP